MQFDKQQIIELLKSKGNQDEAQRADNELPEKVDTDQHAGLLSKLGLSADDLPGGLSGLGSKLGL